MNRLTHFIPRVMPAVVGLAMIGAAYFDEVAFAIAFAAMYVTYVVERAARRIEETTMATGIATGPRHAGAVAERIRAAREVIGR